MGIQYFANPLKTMFAATTGCLISDKGCPFSYNKANLYRPMKGALIIIDGVPELTVDPRCTIMRSAYFGKYVRDEDGNPKKDGFYDHLADCDRYIAYNHKSNSVVKDIIIARKNRHKPTRNRYTGY